MVRIENVRTILLSSASASGDDFELEIVTPSGPMRTVGLVEVTLEDGTVGLGEGAMATFAPVIFEALVDFASAHVIGRDGLDIVQRIADLSRLFAGWSRQGAARHVISALEIALQDASARRLDVPLYDFLGGAHHDSLTVYGSGGAYSSEDEIRRELEILGEAGIGLYKIRSSGLDVSRCKRIVEEAGARGIGVAMDFGQSFAADPLHADEVVAFVERVHAETGRRIVFLEDALGPDDRAGYRDLRARAGVHVYGGRLVTTPADLIDRLQDGLYDAVQPDPGTIGGVSALLEVLAAARQERVGAVVSAAGGPVAAVAGYHAAFAAGERMVEYPLAAFPLAHELTRDVVEIADGHMLLPTGPGLGVTLTPEIEARHPFDESAILSPLALAEL